MNSRLLSSAACALLAAAPLRGEPTQLYSHGDPSAAEQYALELLNAANGADDPPPALAFNPLLLAAARAHAQAMASGNYLGHLAGGGTPAQETAAITARLSAAGYGTFTAAAERLYGPLAAGLSDGLGTLGSLSLPAYAARNTILVPGPLPAFKEAGIGFASGTGANVAPLVMAQDLAAGTATAGTVFITGAAWRDADLDAFYTQGEGLAGITVRPSVGNYYAVTSASGGYAIPLQNVPAGTTGVTLTFSGGALGTATVAKTVTLDGTLNLKADYIDAVVRLINLSTRLRVETGDNVAIAGFVVSGTGSKRVLVRALGPSLAAAGVSGVLADPQLTLANSQGAAMATNDNWADTQAAEISATGRAPSNASESAIVATLAPGAYTAIVRGANAASGVALVEVYDLDPPADPHSINVSTRGIVQTGDNVMIGGFVIKGAAPKRVIIRALGPSLAAAGVNGVLSNPLLQLYNSAGALMLQNDNWADTQAAEISATGRAPSNASESAIVATLAPGAYTAIVRGSGSATGVALVEVYDLE